MALFLQTWSDPNYPKLPIFDILYRLHIFVVSKVGGYKFGS